MQRRRWRRVLLQEQRVAKLERDGHKHHTGASDTIGVTEAGGLADNSAILPLLARCVIALDSSKQRRARLGKLCSPSQPLTVARASLAQAIDVQIAKREFYTCKAVGWAAAWALTNSR